MSTRTHARKSTFLDPRSLVLWVGLGLVVYGLIHQYPLLAQSASVYPGPAALAAILWLVYAVVLAVIVYRLELFERRSPITMVGAFVWGAVVVSGIGVTAAPAMHDLVEKLIGPDLADWVPAIAAPLVEEPLKMLGVVALAFIPGARINSALDGLFFGLLVGLGFEVTESFLYTAQGAASEGGDYMIVVLTFILRGVVGGLWNHPTYTGITGAGVGYFFGSKASAARRWTVMLGSLVVAMILHGFFDSPLVENGNPFVSSVVKGFPALVLLLVLLRIARRRERTVFGGIAETQIPDDLVGPDELETLMNRKSRKRARKALRKEQGMAAAHALKRLQRSQVELVSATGEEGLESDRAMELAMDVRDDRAVLAEVTSRT